MKSVGGFGILLKNIEKKLVFAKISEQPASSQSIENIASIANMVSWNNAFSRKTRLKF